MIRIPLAERPDWQRKADEYGFKFHTMYGERYWDESAYYQFSLEQIENDLETPTEALHQMCLEVVDKVVRDEQLMQAFCIPQAYWDFILNSWQAREPSLYARLDLVYNGKGPAKLLENNADTPTSLFETGFWQWLWLEDQVDRHKLSRHADQFNSLQEKLVHRFTEIAGYYKLNQMHFSCCKDTEEDRGTVQYLQDCAAEAGIPNEFVFVEDIGLTEDGQFSDLQDNAIEHIFKLYPWEFMMDEEYGLALLEANTHWIEPPWKAILSNKALLPLLWKMFPNHPNLLPAYFENELADADPHTAIVRKPIFSREGANISIHPSPGEVPVVTSDGPYGQEGFIYQQACYLPKFADNYTLIGSWLVNDEAAGISVREDASLITQDLSRYLPHIIL